MIHEKKVLTPDSRVFRLTEKGKILLDLHELRQEVQRLYARMHTPGKSTQEYHELGMKILEFRTKVRFLELKLARIESPFESQE